jgi:lysophospholipase L1-like esterase
MLTNTAYRLHNEKKLTIGYFGGSITEGAGASVWDETSWRANITRHLRATYPEAEIKEVNAAIGGTGTDLALVRCEHDLLQYNPNLVFIEFATNDSAFSYEDQLKGYESCLRQILSHDPTTEIVCVFTITKAIEARLLKEGDFRSRTAETTLAYHYGLDMVNIGEHLRMAVAKDGGNWLKYTTDEVHPNDDGYLILTAAMKDALTHLLSEIPDSLTAKTIPASYVNEAEIPSGKIVEVKELLDGAEGWQFIDRRFKRRFPYYVAANGIGSEFTYEFEGTAFGLYWIMDNESGMLDVTLDGKETVTVSAWDEFCKSYSRAGYTYPFRNLEYGKHTVTLRVSDKKDAESLGNRIALFAFLIGTN